MLIDFYILDAASKQKALLFACQLLEKLYQSKQRIYLHTDALDDAEKLDALLWTYREDSFLPHQLFVADAKSRAPILIGYEIANIPAHDILFNLSSAVPTFYRDAKHIIELVFADNTQQQLARERYKYYRDQGLTLNTHQIKANSL